MCLKLRLLIPNQRSYFNVLPPILPCTMSHGPWLRCQLKHSWIIIEFDSDNIIKFTACCTCQNPMFVNNCSSTEIILLNKFSTKNVQVLFYRKNDQQRTFRNLIFKFCGKTCLRIRVKLIKRLECKSNNIRKGSRICCWTIW